MDAGTSGAAVSGGPGMGYPESVESSPRSRGGESWDEPFPSSAAAAAAAAANSKLRLMCSYGGHIVPRPHDKSLCYLGGDTRIVVVERHSTLSDLTAKLSRSLLGGNPFNLKYQLPSEDLDSLISVTTDEDLDNMIEEYDRILSSSPANPTSGGGKPSRLRLFLFPVSTKPESSPSSIGSLLDDSKSETWFVDALNGAMDMLPRGGSSDSASVNCLLGLEEDPHHAAANSIAAPSEQHPDQMLRRPDSSSKLGRQDVHSIPDSPMLDTSSSFGSASSAPSLSNLPPIRVRVDDLRLSDQRMTVEGLEEHFSQMNVKDGGGVSLHRRPPPINPAPLPTATTQTISPNENPSSRVFSSDDENSEHGGGSRKPLQPPTLQQKPNVVDLPSSETIPRPAYYQDRVSPPAMSTGNPLSDQKLEVPASESNYRVPQMQVPEHGYVLPIPAAGAAAAEQLQQQQQYMQANSHMVHHHHHPTSQVVPIQSYYPMHHQIHPQQQLQQTHPFNQQFPMYYMPVRPNPAYNLPVPSNLVDSAPIPSSAKPTIPLPIQAPPQRAANVYRTASTAGSGAHTGVPQPPPPQIIHMADQSQQFMGYHHQINHHPSQSVAAVAPNYGYEYADPVHTQPMYYTQAVSSPMPPQYQTVNAAAIMADTRPPLQQSDLKQGRVP